MHETGFLASELEQLRTVDTCTLSNAIERLGIRPRNEGFVNGEVVCRFPKLPPVVGYAATGRMKAAMQPVTGRCYHTDIDWWRYVESMPKPCILVIQDGDRPSGVGALFGEVHTRICRALNCVAFATNGAVRDLPSIEKLNFQMFSGSVAVSHAYAHIVEFGHPVEIGGLHVAPGDLLHGDMHGLLSVPPACAGQVVRKARELMAEEQNLFEVFEERDFSVDRLADVLHHRIEKRNDAKN